MALLLARALPAQVPDSVPRSDTSWRTPLTPSPGAINCDGRTVSDVHVLTKSPYPNGLTRRWRALADAVREGHVNTRPNVIRRFLALREGDICTELRRTESERLLRAQPFIADATVTAVDDGEGGVRIDVVTVDAVAIVADVGVKAPAHLTKLVFGNANVAGNAIYLSGSWRQGGVYRDDYGIRFVDYQLLGRPYHLSALAARHTHGGEWMTQASHPFFTDFQRTAWRTTIGENRTLYSVLQPGARSPAVGVSWTFADVGGIVRIGVPGRLSLFGASLSREQSNPDERSIYILPTGLQHANIPELEQYTTHRSARLNGLWGVRNISFVRVRSFDAVNGVQDVRKGFQLGTLFGRSLQVLGSQDDDILVAAELYGGNGSDQFFTAFQIQGEGRQNYDQNNWDGIQSSGRFAVYMRPDERHTMIASAEYGAGWRQLVPFQLGLGRGEGGVRGYGAARVGGAQRAVLRAEERWFIGRPFDVGDAGLSFFSDLGRVWAGDAPLGMDSYWRMSAGIGLVAGVPSGSRRMWRLDMAVPLSRIDNAKVEFRLSNRDMTRSFWRSPDDMQRSHSGLLPTSVFNWP